MRGGSLWNGAIVVPARNESVIPSGQMGRTVLGAELGRSSFRDRARGNDRVVTRSSQMGRTVLGVRNWVVLHTGTERVVTRSEPSRPTVRNDVSGYSQ